MKKNRLISMLLAIIMILTVCVPPELHANGTPTVVTGTVRAFDAAGNSGQIPSDEPDYSYWKVEIVEGNGTPWSVVRFVNKKTGLYLCETNGELIQTSDSENAGTKFKLGDWYGLKWRLMTMDDRGIGVDATITAVDSGTAVGSDHLTDTVFNGEGYELVRFSADGSYSNADSLTDGAYYVLHTKSPYGDWMHTCLTADPVQMPSTVVTGTVQAFNASENSGQIPSEEPDYSYWKVEIVEGNGTPWSVIRLVNKKTGLYLCETDGQLIQTSDSENAGTKFKLGDWYGSKWRVMTMDDRTVGVDAGVTAVDTGTAAGSDHLSDTVFNGEGYELLRFSTDGSFSNADSLTDGAYYVVHTKSPYGDWMQTCLTADPVEGTDEVEQKFLEIETLGNASEYSWWKFITSGSEYKIQNVKTGYYLTNKEGKLALTNMAETDNELWKHVSNYGITGHLQSKADDSWITVYQGTTVLTSNDSFSWQGTQSIRIFDENGQDYHTTVQDAASSDKAVKICNRDDYDNGRATYLTARPEVGTDDVEQKFYEIETLGDASEYSWWKFIASGSEYKIQNAKTGYYLTNKEGTLALTNTAKTNNELWKHVSNYGITGHLQSKADNSWITVLGGTTALTSNDSFSYQGTQSIRIFDENGQDYHTTVQEVASSGNAVKICNRDDYDNGRATYITATTDEHKEVAPPTKVELSEVEAVKTVAYDVESKGMPTDDKENYLWTAFSTPNGWIFQNVSNGFVLTDNGTALTAQSYIEEKFQYWTMKDNYGYKWIMHCNKGERYLNTDGIINFLGVNQDSKEEHETDGINNFEWYEMIHFSTDGINETSNIMSGKSYYIYNVTQGDSNTFKQLLGVTDDSAKIKLPVVPDTIMDGQDVANTPISISEPLDVKITGLNAIKKEGTQIWIFKEVTLDTPIKSLWDVYGGVNEQAEIATGFTIQNKETGLYLTQIGEQIYQDRENGTASQIWIIEDYPFGHEDLKLVRSYGNGYQLVLEQNSYGLYNPNNWKNDLALQDEWPDLVAMNGGPVSGTATICFARVTTDVNEGEDIFPEDGKGYYIYNSAYGFGGSLLEAISEKVNDSTSDIPAVEKDPYCKTYTYIADLDKGIKNDDKNWDLLFDARVEDGKIVGSPSCESGIYGVAFKRRTSGCGTSELNFALRIPSYVDEYVSIALRLNDYYDIAADQTGLRIYINKDGRVGLKFAGNSEIVTYVETGYSFTETRNVYVCDNADTNTVSLYFDVDGTKTKIADFTINNGTVVMTPTADPTNTITKFYGYNIYFDGFWSVTTAGFDVEISDIQAVIPRYSKVAFDVDAETVIGGGDKTMVPEDDNTNDDNAGLKDEGSNDSGNDATGNKVDNSTTKNPNTSGSKENSSDKNESVENENENTESSDETKDDNVEKPDDEATQPEVEEVSESESINILIPIAIIGLASLMAILIIILAILKKRKDNNNEKYAD